jgi:CRP-like cAMP-binding protein
MPLLVSQDVTRNRLLATMSASDFALLQPLLASVELPVHKVLQTRGRKIETVYFLESGAASIIVNAGPAHTIEIGMVGREGATGVAIFLGSDISPNDTFVQSSGTGWRLSGKDMMRVMGESPSLRAHLVLYGHTLMVQMQYTTLSDGRYKIDERLARWMLMALDRCDSDVVTLTHEFLAIMLGVRRPGVTIALNALERRGVIETKRGKITVLSRPALQEAANGSYGAPEAEFNRCFVGGTAS